MEMIMVRFPVGTYLVRFKVVHQTIIWMVDDLIRASKVTGVHSGLGLRRPMLQWKIHRQDSGQNAKIKEIGTSTTSL